MRVFGFTAYQMRVYLIEKFTDAIFFSILCIIIMGLSVF